MAGSLGNSGLRPGSPRMHAAGLQLTEVIFPIECHDRIKLNSWGQPPSRMRRRFDSSTFRPPDLIGLNYAPTARRANAQAELAPHPGQRLLSRVGRTVITVMAPSQTALSTPNPRGTRPTDVRLAASR